MLCVNMLLAEYFTKFGGSDSSESGDDSLPYPKPLTRAAFLTPDFDATTFLSSLRNRHQTLEDLRAELRSRSQELNKELLDLVNDNYQDFLSLGSSLHRGEEKVEEVRLGLMGFRRDVEGLRAKVENKKTEVEVLIARKKAIGRDIQLGRTLLEFDQRLSQLEQKLMLTSSKPTIPGQEDISNGSSDSDDDSDEEQGISSSRLQRHAQQYTYIARLINRIGNNHLFVLKQQDRVLKAKNTILLDLSMGLKQAHGTLRINEDRVLKFLDIYKDMNEIPEAVRVLKECKRKS